MDRTALGQCFKTTFLAKKSVASAFYQVSCVWFVVVSVPTNASVLVLEHRE